MRITLLANRDLASNMAINLLLQQLPEHHYCIFLSAKVGKLDNVPEPLKNLAFIEQTLFNQIVFPVLASQQHCKAKISTPPARQSSRFKSFQQMAHDSVPVSDIKDINSLAGIQRIAEQKPELIISIRFGQILKDPIISIPSLGVINLHSGKLPDYRGVMATFWAMLDNKEEIGTSLHFIDSCQIDAGKIISSTQQKVNYSQSYLLNVLALYPQGVNNIVSAVNRLNRGETLDTRSMDLASGNYYSFPDSTTLNQFIEQGKQLINYDEIPSIIEKYL